MVSRTKRLGKCLVQLLSTMQGEFGLAAPHGPCIMNYLTASCPIESSKESGISALIMLSISSGTGYLSSGCKNTNICACGNLFFGTQSCIQLHKI